MTFADDGAMIREPSMAAPVAEGTKPKDETTTMTTDPQTGISRLSDEATRSHLAEDGIAVPSLDGTWYLAPVTDQLDEYAAGYDGNTFPSREDAEAAIPGLQACGEDFAATEWVAVQREVRS